jgi:hypothetical protein
MLNDVTFTEIKNSFAAIAGLASFTPTDEFFLQGSVNLAVKKAYDKSILWPRYLVIGEERNVLTSPANTIAFTQASKNDIGEFIKIYQSEPFVLRSPREYEFVVSSAGAKIVDFQPSSATTAYVTYKKNLVTNYTPDSTDIPSEFRDFIIYSALSDFYMGDGQNDKAVYAMQIANDNLDLQLSRLENKRNNQIFSCRISTHNSRQSRN